MPGLQLLPRQLCSSGSHSAVVPGFLVMGCLHLHSKMMASVFVQVAGLVVKVACWVHGCMGYSYYSGFRWPGKREAAGAGLILGVAGHFKAPWP